MPRPGNPPPAPPRPPDGPREGAFALPSRLLCAALFVACGPGGLAPPPAPRASLAGYQIGADAAPPPRPPADEYADLFAFREGRAARPAAEPWPPGA
ncbi:MAG TPA: hypothetical protein VFS00_29980, partial [Polyangiaceae bacterium]|nr:hypothetical protein [Polyangiaceae bacterium]